MKTKNIKLLCLTLSIIASFITTSTYTFKTNAMEDPNSKNINKEENIIFDENEKIEILYLTKQFILDILKDKDNYLSKQSIINMLRAKDYPTDIINKAIEEIEADYNKIDPCPGGYKINKVWMKQAHKFAEKYLKEYNINKGEIDPDFISNLFNELGKKQFDMPLDDDITFNNVFPYLFCNVISYLKDSGYQFSEDAEKYIQEEYEVDGWDYIVEFWENHKKYGIYREIMIRNLNYIFGDNCANYLFNKFEREIKPDWQEQIYILAKSIYEHLELPEQISKYTLIRCLENVIYPTVPLNEKTLNLYDLNNRACSRLKISDLIEGEIIYADYYSDKVPKYKTPDQYMYLQEDLPKRELEEAINKLTKEKNINWHDQIIEAAKSFWYWDRYSLYKNVDANVDVKDRNTYLEKYLYENEFSETEIREFLKKDNIESFWKDRAYNCAVNEFYNFIYEEGKNNEKFLKKEILEKVKEKLNTGKKIYPMTDEDINYALKEMESNFPLLCKKIIASKLASSDLKDINISSIKSFRSEVIKTLNRFDLTKQEKLKICDDIEKELYKENIKPEIIEPALEEK